MKNCNSVATPTNLNLKLTKDHNEKEIDDTLYKQIIGSLMYLATIRLDIMHAVNLISKYMKL